MPIYNGNYYAPVWLNNEPPAINQAELRAMSGTLQNAQILTGSGAPTQYTEGVVGQLYVDEDTDEIYQCVSVGSGTYTWIDKADNVAQPYDPTDTYAEGAYCTYEGLLYKSNTDIDPPESWNSAHWERSWLGDDLSVHVEDTNNPHGVTAAQAAYDNTDSGLTADDAQEAIDELANGKADKSATVSSVSYDGPTGKLQKTINGVSSDVMTVDASPTSSSNNPVKSGGVYTALGGKQDAIAAGSVTLYASWSGSGPYTQTVTVTGATVTANSRVSFEPTAAQLASLISDGVTALTIENNAGTLTVYALGAAPSAAMTLACTVTEVSA